MKRKPLTGYSSAAATIKEADARSAASTAIKARRYLNMTPPEGITKIFLLIG
jgi:hypothetical protein